MSMRHFKRAVDRSIQFTLRHNLQRHLGQSEDWIFLSVTGYAQEPQDWVGAQDDHEHFYLIISLLHFERRCK